MPQSLTKILSLFLSFCLILEQSVFAQTIDLSHYFANSGKAILQGDKFRPMHLRYISYDTKTNDFQILLDKGDFFNQKTEKPKNGKTPEFLNSSTPKLEETTQELMKYFFIGLALPNEKFWVNLRPDSPDNILDPDLEKTDIGRIFLEADLQLKKDTSGMTSPQTPEGKAYWDKLYKKAGELFGSQNITIPTITRPWIVPGEIIIGESSEGAYIYKATLKVMLEEDYLNNQKTEKPKNGKTEVYNFADPRLKELNQYSSQIIRETIIPKLTYEINTSKRYAPLRQVYYSLILAQWFKQKYERLGNTSAPGASAPANKYIDLIDSGNLANLKSSQPYDKQTYFQQYQKSFQDGEYNLQEPVHTPTDQSIRRYISGGLKFSSSPTTVIKTANPININMPYLIPVSSPITGFFEDYLKEPEVKNYPSELQKILREIKELELDRINPDGTLTIKIVPRNDSSENILRFRICQQDQAKHFAYKYNQAEKILYLRNLDTRKDIGIGITGKIPSENGDKYWLYVDRPYKKKKGFILSDNVYTFDGTELTNRMTGIIHPMSEGIIDFTKITDSLGIKDLLNLSTSSALEEKDAEIVKNRAEKLYQAITDLHEEIIKVPQGHRKIILEGWSFKIKDAIANTAGLEEEEKALLGKIIHDAIMSAHKHEYGAIAESIAAKNGKTGQARIQLVVDIVKQARERINNDTRFSNDEKEVIKTVFSRVNSLTSSSIDINEHYVPASSAAETAVDNKKQQLLSILTGDDLDITAPLKQTYILAVDNFLNELFTEIDKLSSMKPIDLRRRFEDTAVYRELIAAKWSAFFRYPGEFEAISEAKEFKDMITNKAEKFHDTGNKQTVDIAIIGAAYGQEPISVAAYFSRIIKETLKRENLDILSEGIGLKVHVFDKPDTVYNKVKKNEIIYPADVLGHSWGEYSDGFESYFTWNTDGYIRSQKLESLLNFYDVDLNDERLSAKKISNKNMDIVMVHNVLSHLSTLRQDSVARYLDALLKSGGILSITTNYPSPNNYLEKILREKYFPLTNNIKGQYYDGIYKKSAPGDWQRGEKDKGGIDFSHQEIIAQPISGLQSLAGSPLAINSDLDFEGEWRGIQAVFNAGVRPSARRMAEFAVSAGASPLNSRRLEDLRGLVTDLLRRDEEDEKPAPADPALKELLAIL